MTRTSKMLGAAGTLTLALLATNAHAAGTTAGSTITNTASVSYTVGTVAQTAVTASDTLTVDRRINLTVAEFGSPSTTSVTPGQTAAVTAFTVTNTSNAVLDFALAITQPTTGTTAHGGTDTFDVTAASVKFYVDNPTTGTVGSYDAGDALVTYLDELAVDTTRTVFVVSDIPIGQVNGDVAGITLTATANAGGTAATQGAPLVQTTTANTSGMDTVFADAAGATDGARDAAFSARDDYTVSSALISVIKSSTIISDPINGTTNPKFIPGAVIQYCIAVTNGSGGAAATGVGVNDPLPGTVTYVTSSIKLNGSVVSGVCQTDGTAGGTFGSNTVSGTLGSIAAGTTKTLLFQATIN